MLHINDWPPVLLRRLILSAGVGAGYLLIGLVLFFTTNDRVLLTISALLALCTILRCAALYRLARDGAYEVVEGVCIRVGSAHLRKQRSVCLLTLEGAEQSVTLDKRIRLRIGNCYRIYFQRPAISAPELMPLQDLLAGSQFLGLEDLGEYREPGRQENSEPCRK